MLQKGTNLMTMLCEQIVLCTFLCDKTQKRITQLKTLHAF